jgi:DNA-binding transcriptional ArsR family regulator
VHRTVAVAAGSAPPRPCDSTEGLTIPLCPSTLKINRLVEEQVDMDVERQISARCVDDDDLGVLDDRLSPVFAALADPTRRGLVARLAVGDADVGELAEPYDMSIQAVSKHLKVLEGAGLVSKTNHGRRRTVHLEAEVFDLMTKWIERYRRGAEERYRRLDGLLDELNDRTNPNEQPGNDEEQTA